jgi:hypothetical protein
MERTVTLSSFDDIKPAGTEGSNATRFDTIKAEVGYVEFTQAIGYLSTWCVNAYPKVTIYANHRDLEMQASYFKPDGSFGYLIAAVWNGTAFGFHS